MSTNHSVGRFTATQEKDRSTATQENDRSAVTHKADRSKVTQKVDALRPPLRRTVPAVCFHLCRWPPVPHSAPLRPSASLRFSRPKGGASQPLNRLVRYIFFFFGNYLSACDLSAALGRVFSAVAQGHLKPKAATALAYLGQTLNQSVKLAGDEYANVFGRKCLAQKGSGMPRTTAT